MPLIDVGGVNEVARLAIEMLKRHEGFRSHPYPDSLGYETIGYGRNLSQRGISEGEAAGLLANDVDDALSSLLSLPFFNALNQPRQVALIDLVVNLGFDGFQQFKRTIAALEAGDFGSAGEELLESRAYQEEPRRIYELSLILQTGAFQQADKPEQA